MNRWQSLWRLIPLFAVMTFLLTGCGDDTLSTLRPKGDVAREQMNLMMLSLIIMVFVVVIVFALYIYVLIRFRKRKGQTGIPKQVEGSHVLELIWTVIPIILLLVLAVPTVTTTFDLAQDFKDDKDVLRVKVTAHAFWWEFDYEGMGIKTAQELVVPAGKKVAFEITSADIIHSFWVPSLGGKVDATPGLLTKLYLEADADQINATFRGKCAELCGASHALMDFGVKSLAQADFDKWVADMKAPVTIPASAKAGEEIFKAKCLQCHAITPDGAGLGPNLNGFANREKVAGILPMKDESRDAALKHWISDPQDVKPGNNMPQLPLSEAQINDVIQYLNALK